MTRLKRRVARAGLAIAVSAVMLWMRSGPAAQEPSAGEVVLVGAGDIANCELAGGTGATATGRLLDHIQGTIFTVGDHALPSGTKEQYENCYGPRWGGFKERTRPSPGNHDYRTANGVPYFDYFGERAGPDRRGYYSYDMGAWHIISLNSFINADRQSDQIRWLRDDLRQAKAVCTLAYWHIPVFSSGPHGREAEAGHMIEAWRALYEAGADVVLNGHDHDYERFAPQTPDGKPDSRGIREFVVGTGGGGLYNWKGNQKNSEARANRSYGVLKLTLRATEYNWEFISAAGEPFKDAGTAACVQ